MECPNTLNCNNQFCRGTNCKKDYYPDNYMEQAQGYGPNVKRKTWADLKEPYMNDPKYNDVPVEPNLFVINKIYEI